MTDDALLTVEAMYEVDRRTIASGVRGALLMERAGRAVAGAAARMRAPGDGRPVVVLAGPGANGGDGFAAARLLAEEGAPVRLALLGDRSQLTGDAAVMADLFQGDVRAFDPSVLDGAGLVVDAIFGAGLNRSVGGRAREMIEAIARSGAPVLAVDVPSGLDGDTGLVRGACAPATRTVTFVRPKPGHYLYPGRGLCGGLEVADIGAPDAVVDAVRSLLRLNGPGAFQNVLREPRVDQHKYDRGWAAVVSGGLGRTGAARLAAVAAARSGIGAVTVLGPADAVPELAAHLTSVMIREIAAPADVASFLADRRLGSVVVGPGCGVGPETAALAAAALASGKKTVIDADALTSFAADPDDLFSRTAGRRAVMTPHLGEFARLFPDLDPGEIGALAAAREAAARAGCVLLLKGPTSVVAGPDGRAVLNVNAGPGLATAGSGDVLAGLIAAVMARAPDAGAVEAAAAGAWIHGEMGRLADEDFIAEDLPVLAPRAWRAARDALANGGRATPKPRPPKPLDGAGALR
ncbi:MAG: NAD(P)H-hydrate dehydratase [Pseudomonadota bacterium]